MNRFTELYRKRIFVFKDVAVEAAFFFKEDVAWNEEGEKVLKKHEGISNVFSEYADVLDKLQNFDHSAVEEASRDFMKKSGLSGKQFIHPARVAITGRLVSPGFFETVSLLGKERAVKRLHQAATKLK